MGHERSGNLLALAVLSLLRERPMHPYEISTVMRERGLSFSIKLNFGSLYSVIAGLLVGGSIAIKATEREGNHPERTIYSITEKGVDRLHAELRPLISVPEKEYPRFMAGLAFLAHFAPAEAKVLLGERSSSLAAKVAEERGRLSAIMKTGVDELFLVEMDYSLTLREAELDWIRKVIAKIEDGTLAASVDGSLVWKALQAEAKAEPDEAKAEPDEAKAEPDEAKAEPRRPEPATTQGD